MSFTKFVLDEIHTERIRQEQKWGQQNHPILDPSSYSKIRERYCRKSASEAKDIVEALAYNGELTYMDILLEEIWEAIEAKDIVNLREDLIQIAAVSTAMVESLDRNHQ